MTKKHFIQLADTVRDINNSIIQHVRGRELPLSPEWVIQLIETELADFCKSQNGEFKRERWLAYIAGECGPNGGQVKAG